MRLATCLASSRRCQDSSQRHLVAPEDVVLVLAKQWHTMIEPMRLTITFLSNGQYDNGLLGSLFRLYGYSKRTHWVTPLLKKDCLVLYTAAAGKSPSGPHPALDDLPGPFGVIRPCKALVDRSVCILNVCSYKHLNSNFLLATLRLSLTVGFGSRRDLYSSCSLSQHIWTAQQAFCSCTAGALRASVCLARIFGLAYLFSTASAVSVTHTVVSTSVSPRVGGAVAIVPRSASLGHCDLCPALTQALSIGLACAS